MDGNSLTATAKFSRTRIGDNFCWWLFFTNERECFYSCEKNGDIEVGGMLQ